MRSCKCVLSVKNRSQRVNCAASRPDEPSQEVPQVVELAMLLVLDIDDTPSILATSNRATINDDIPFRANDSEGDHVISVPIDQKGP